MQDNNDKKEIQVMEFMLKKDNHQDITKDDHKIFHENDKKFEELDRRDKKIQRIKKLAIYSGAFVVLTSSVVLLKKQIDYLDRPTTIVVNDIMANEGLLETPDGKQVDARMFDREHKAELYEYCQKHNIDPAVLKSQIIHKYIQEHKDVNEDLLMDQLEERYPGVLNNDLVISVEHETKAK